MSMLLNPYRFALGAGQIVFEGETNELWTVPAGVESICAVSVGWGGSSLSFSNESGGGGGALSYSNDIAVTPGEQLQVVIADGELSRILRGATILLSADYGRNGGDFGGGAGGQAVNGVGQVKYSGGDGDHHFNFDNGGGGGAAGYAGDGGKGAGDDTSWEPGTGGAAAGGLNNAGSGGGVGLKGVGPSGTDHGEGGSGGTDGVSFPPGAGREWGGRYGGGSGGERNTSGPSGGIGGIRIIWGEGRSYPNNAADV